MDIFTLDPTTYNNGELINGIESIQWIERYDSHGEFTILAPPTFYIRDKLKRGTFISHIDTLEVMRVEDHYIDDSVDGPSNVKITGRSVDVIAMENRVVTTEYTGSHWVDTSAFVPGSKYAEGEMIYRFTDINTWDQIAKVIYDFCENSIESPAENLPNFHVETRISETESVHPKRTADDFGLLSDVVYSILPTISAGLKVERPCTAHPGTLNFVIHKGVDLSATVAFDWGHGDVSDARYLFSDKDLKDSAYVNANGFRLKLNESAHTGWDLKTLSLDLGTLNLTSGTLPSAFQVLVSRTRDEIARLNGATILDATVSPTSRYTYGYDYSIGDIVSVIGNYDVSANFRVTEYARTMDKDGESGFPTLSQP